MGRMIVLNPENNIVFQSVTRTVTNDNSDVSNHACLFLPHRADASWPENALKVDQSFFHIKVITEFVSQAQNARVTKTDILRKCKYSLINESSAII